MGSSQRLHAAPPDIDPNANVPISDQSVTLEDWNPLWPERFAAEADRLGKAEIPGIVRIDHIGSTAVVGMAAKPILDVALSVTVRPQSPRVIAEIERLGYRYFGSYGLRGRHFFRLGEPAQIHLHVIGQRSPHLNAWLDFRNALNEESDYFSHYLNEKRRLATIHAADRASYTAAKGPVISAILHAYRARRRESASNVPSPQPSPGGRGSSGQGD